MAKALTHPANLDFEESTAEGRPAYWSVPEGIASVEFQVEDAADRPHSGRRCGVIKRAPGRHYGEVFGELSQRINAAEFREQTVRLEAAVRVEGVSPGSQAYLWLRVESLLGQASYATAPISAPKWQMYELTAPISPTAQKISYAWLLWERGEPLLPISIW